MWPLLTSHTSAVKHFSMDTYWIRIGSYWSARRFFAWLLIALMLPGSLANSAFVWCVASNGHSAIEFSIHTDCHRSHVGDSATAQSTATDVAHLEYCPQYSDCTDVAAIPNATVVAHFLGKSDASLCSPYGGDDFPVLARLYPLVSKENLWQSSGPRSRSQDVFVDPNLRLRGSTVLRI